MTANHRGRGPSNRIPSNLMSALALIGSFLCAAVAYSAPPYDITVSFNAPSAGPLPDSYNLYIDDCAVGGPAGAAYAAGVTSGQVYTSALTSDGTFDVCVRTVNATGENPDPGQVATIVVADLPIPNPVENLDVQVACPNGGCTVTVTVN